MLESTLVTTVGRRARRRPAKILIDTALLAAFVVVFLTREPSFDPDYLVHSLVGLSLVPIVFVHLAGNIGWVARLWRNKGHDREARLGVANAVLAAATAVCVVSGIPLWLDWTQHSMLSVTHVVSGFGSIAVVLVHLVMNRRRIVRLVRPAS